MVGFSAGTTCQRCQQIGAAAERIEITRQASATGAGAQLRDGLAGRDGPGLEIGCQAVGPIGKPAEPTGDQRQGATGQGDGDRGDGQGDGQGAIGDGVPVGRGDPIDQGVDRGALAASGSAKPPTSPGPTAISPKARSPSVAAWRQVRRTPRRAKYQ